MAQNQQRIKELLGTGLSAELVATTVGCDPSYISQLMSEDDFREEVIALRSTALTANSQRDKSIDGIEDKLIEKLAEAVDSNLLYKPNDLLRAFAVVNNAKRRGVPAHESLVINNRVVNLNLPMQVLNHVTQFVTNQQGEVVEAEGQTLVTMPAHQLLKQLAGKGEKHAEQYEKISRFLPGTFEAGGSSS